MTELKRILLVEDSLQDVELTLTALAENNLANEVVVVRDGEAALDFLFRRGEYRLRAPGGPAVVLLDLKLPKLSGLEVLQKMRAHEATRLVPVVMLTSSKEELDVTQSYEFGVNAYVVKPVRFDEFVRAVQELGIFWALINEAPPLGSEKASAP